MRNEQNSRYTHLMILHRMQSIDKNKQNLASLFCCRSFFLLLLFVFVCLLLLFLFIRSYHLGLYLSQLLSLCLLYFILLFFSSNRYLCLFVCLYFSSLCFCSSFICGFFYCLVLFQFVIVSLLLKSFA